MIIGLTGGIASGKSTVSGMLAGYGAEIIDADKVARDIVQPGSAALERIEDCYGSGVLNGDGTLNRKALGDIVFSDYEKLKLLNDITHPEIKKAVRSKIDEINSAAQHRIIVVDAAVLLETGMDKLVDEVWLVVVDYKTQVKRLMERDGITLRQARVRIESQMPVEDKVKLSHRIIDNNGSLEYTKKQVDELWYHITNTGGNPFAS